MKHPLLIEIQTRRWLRGLSPDGNRRITLAETPDIQVQQWRDLGVSHVWLMGVWPTGPLSRERALHNPALRARCDAALPGWKEDELEGSPYAIASYQVDEALGGEGELADFRDRLHTRGLRLALDFIPNHLGLDHPWRESRPEFFVQSAVEREGAIHQRTSAGDRWLAHGRDPFFPPWDDTLQLDYRRADTRVAILGELRRIAEQCDGVRCDMAILMLKEVFADTWKDWPLVDASHEARGEFWREAIREIKARHPDFLFLAEAYWNREKELQSLGFDFTYDKGWLDELAARKPAEAIRHLHDQPAMQLHHGARFLENHDEARAASVFSLDEHRAAAVATFALPGMRFLHEGQLEGAVRQVPVQLSARQVEPVDAHVQEMYERILTALRSIRVGKSDAELLRALPAWTGNPTCENFLLVQCGVNEVHFGLVVVNLANHRGQCHAPLRLPGDAPASQWRFQDLLGDEKWLRDCETLIAHGLFLDVPAHGAQVFECQPVD